MTNDQTDIKGKTNKSAYQWQYIDTNERQNVHRVTHTHAYTSEIAREGECAQAHGQKAEKKKVKEVKRNSIN